MEFQLDAKIIFSLHTALTQYKNNEIITIPKTIETADQFFEWLHKESTSENKNAKS